jgi:hypothetical protein
MCRPRPLVSAPRWLLGLTAVGALLAGGCVDDDPTGTTTTTEAPPGAPSPPSADAVATPAVEGPITGGAGSIVLGPGGIDLATVGYVEEEFFLSGTATAYTSDEPLGTDGAWDATEDGTAPYTTRIVVRRPTDPGAFDGTVYVEWLNVTGGLDADPDWTLVAPELIRSGSTWIGVSAQKGGIEGGSGPVGDSFTLKKADPERYGALEHPGDDYSYDVFSQAGAAVWFAPERVLAGAAPQVLLAVGHSQSAFRLTTYVNALTPPARAAGGGGGDGVFDGFLLHSPGARGAPLATEPRPVVEAPDPTLVRTDLDVPVLVFSTETDLVGDGLGYGRARQPDTEHIRGWEVAGTAHYDAYGLGIGDTDDGSGAADAALFAAMTDPPSSVYGGVITCEAPINTGPQTYVLRSAVAALADWAGTGTPPAEQPRLDLDATGTDLVRDEIGNAVGGIRTPQVEAPVAALSGLGQEGESFCFLFGTTRPLGGVDLASRYGDQAAFRQRWDAAVTQAVDAGVLVPADADHLRRVAAESQVAPD